MLGITSRPLCITGYSFFVKKLYTYIKASQEQLGTITDFFVESVANMSLIKTFTAESQIINEMQRDNIQYRTTQIKLASIRSTMFPFIATIGSIGQIILLYVGGKLVISEAITIGELVAFSSYLVLLAWPTAALSWIINIIQRGLASLNRVQDILSTSPHPQLHHPSIHNLTQAPTIEINHLSFSYDADSDPILKDVSFRVESGQRLGIFGASGSGKTTLASILSLIEPTAPGTLFFNGQDVTESNVKPLRDCISVVPQRRFLFSTSIANNIAFSDPTMAENDHQAAATRACVITDILAFPNQWDTLVGEKGVILSGGQQHRLAMARAYAAKHNVLILDDVLSSVDHDTEQQMIDALFNEEHPPTTIIIAHRISALQHCDHIIVLEDGCIRNGVATMT